MHSLARCSERGYHTSLGSLLSALYAVAENFQGPTEVRMHKLILEKDPGYRHLPVGGAADQEEVGWAVVMGWPDRRLLTSPDIYSQFPPSNLRR